MSDLEPVAIVKQTYEQDVEWYDPSLQDGVKLYSGEQREQLQEENDALRARVGRLELACVLYYEFGESFDNAHCENAEQILNETPQQSLAEIEAAATKKALKGFAGWYMVMSKPVADLVVSEVDHYLNDLFDLPEITADGGAGLENEDE